MSEKKPTIAGLLARVEELVEKNNAMHIDLSAARGGKQIAEKNLAAANGEISYLKDELHRLTIENARLNGYQDRVHEFDPVTERQQHADRQHPQRDGEVPHHLFNMADTAARYRGGGELPSAPWYRRG
jgi:regulator of replication initiation timing